MTRYYVAAKFVGAAELPVPQTAPPHIHVRHICADRVSDPPEPARPAPAFHGACRCDQSRSRRDHQLERGSRSQRCQHATQCCEIHVTTNTNPSSVAQFNFNQV